MKSKKTVFLTLIFVGLVSLSLVGCTQKDDDSSQLPNPMISQPTLADIQTAIGFTFDTLPTDVTDLKLYTIGDTLAQADFTSNKIVYTARKSSDTTEDISGVYIKFSNGETLTNATGDSVLYEYNDNAEGLATWKSGKHLCTLYCPTDFNLDSMTQIVDSIK
jgi:hypothetical protein